MGGVRACSNFGKFAKNLLDFGNLLLQVRDMVCIIHKRLHNGTPSKN